MKHWIYIVFSLFIAGCAVTGVNDYVVGVNADGKDITQRLVSQAAAVQPLGGHAIYSTVWMCVKAGEKDVCEMKKDHWTDDGRGWGEGLLDNAVGLGLVGWGLSASGDTTNVMGSNATANARSSSAAKAAAKSSSSSKAFIRRY